jgi:hypothetical protein
MKLGPINVRPFVLTVSEYTERTEFIRRHLRAEGIEAEEFDCINANLAGLKTIHPYERDAPDSGWNIGSKPVCLLVSFQMFWKAALYMPDDYFLFLEWDCKFLPGWRERTEQALLDVPPDFDFLFLGSCCCNGKPQTHVKGEVWDVKYPMCNHAQIIAKKALHVLLSTQRKFYAPADISLALHAFPLLKVYTVLPRVAEQFDTVLEP